MRDDFNPYAVPADITPKKPRVVRLLRTNHSSRAGEQLITHLARQQKDEFGQPLNPFFMAFSGEEGEILTMSHNPDVKRERQILEAVKHAGAVLYEAKESKGGTKEYELVGCDMNYPTIKPAPLTPWQQENISQAAAVLREESQRIIDIMTQQNSHADNYRITNTCQSIIALSEAIAHQDLGQYQAIKDKVNTPAILSYHLNGEHGLHDNIHRGLFHPDKNSLTDEEKKMISAAEETMSRTYQAHEQDINAGLHQLLYQQAERAYEQQQADLPKGCLGAMISGPIDLVKNVAVKCRPGRGEPS